MKTATLTADTVALINLDLVAMIDQIAAERDAEKTAQADREKWARRFADADAACAELGIEYGD